MINFEALISSLPGPSCNDLYSFGDRRQYDLYSRDCFLCMRLLNHYQAPLLCKLESIFRVCNQQVNHQRQLIYLGYFRLERSRQKRL